MRRKRLTLATAGDVLSAREAAVIARCRQAAILAALADGRLFGSRLGRGWRIPRPALEQYLLGSVPAQRPSPSNDDGHRASLPMADKETRGASPHRPLQRPA